MRDHGVDWGSLHTRDGVGMDPGLIRALLHAPDAGSGREAYDRLESKTFYSRQLEEAALPVTRVLVDAVCDGECTYWGTVLAADALVELTCGETPPGEEHSNEDLDSRCRAVVRARLPRLYRMADNETTDDMVLSCLITVVCNVEDDTPTRQAFLAGTPVGPGRRAGENFAFSGLRGEKEGSRYPRREQKRPPFDPHGLQQHNTGVELVQGPSPRQVGGQVASSMAARLGAARPRAGRGQGRQVLQAAQADQLQDPPWSGGKRLCTAPAVLVPGSVAI